MFYTSLNLRLSLCQTSGNHGCLHSGDKSTNMEDWAMFSLVISLWV